jgi:hypothetical protein
MQIRATGCTCNEVTRKAANSWKQHFLNDDVSCTNLKFFRLLHKALLNMQTQDRPCTVKGIKGHTNLCHHKQTSKTAPFAHQSEGIMRSIAIVTLVAGVCIMLPHLSCQESMAEKSPAKPVAADTSKSSSPAAPAAAAGQAKGGLQINVSGLSCESNTTIMNLYD